MGPSPPTWPPAHVRPAPFPGSRARTLVQGKALECLPLLPHRLPQMPHRWRHGPRRWILRPSPHRLRLGALARSMLGIVAVHGHPDHSPFPMASCHALPPPMPDRGRRRLRCAATPPAASSGAVTLQDCLLEGINHPETHLIITFTDEAAASGPFTWPGSIPLGNSADITVQGPVNITCGVIGPFFTSAITLELNTTTVDGSCIFTVEDPGSHLKLTGCTLKPRSLPVPRVTIRNGANLTVEGTTFTGAVNVQTAVFPDPLGMGGAIRAEGGTLLIERSSFIDCGAAAGGAVALRGYNVITSLPVSGFHVTIKDTSFTGCTSNALFAAPDTPGAPGAVPAAGGLAGGALLAYGPVNLELSDCTFESNSAPLVSAPLKGGAVAIKGHTDAPLLAGYSGVRISRTAFKGNSANEGGGLYVHSLPSLLVEDSAFINNAFRLQPASFAAAGLSSICSGVTVRRTRFIGQVRVRGCAQ
jgi:hypothetical protein